MEPKEEKRAEENQGSTGEKQPKTNVASEELFAEYLQSFRARSEPERPQVEKRYKEISGEHKFWDKQPVPKPQNLAEVPAGPMEKKKLDEVSAEPTKLPEGFTWCGFDLNKEEELKEVYTMLTNNYVEDDEGYFRFDYSADFLKWALMPPGYNPDLILGIRDAKTSRLVGFITGQFVHLNIEGKKVRVTEVNFLCVIKSFRKYSMASILIREVTRRSNVKGVWQGFYTSGTLLPTPFAEARYYHRSLNPKKLLAANFSYKPEKQTMGIYTQLNSLSEKPSFEFTGTLRRAELKDLKQCKKLLETYLQKFKVHVEHTMDEFKHFFLPRDRIIETFVIVDKDKVTDFISFYVLPSTILTEKCPYKLINAAYCYYFANTTLTVPQLFEIALLKAKELDFDVFNALDIMDNAQAFEKLNFNPGDGFLKYYLFNWVLNQKLIHPSELGATLV